MQPAYIYVREYLHVFAYVTFVYGYVSHVHMYIGDICTCLHVIHENNNNQHIWA